MFVIRPAARADISAITAIMRASLLSIGRQAYNEQQIDSALLYIGRPDEQLIDDGTYFVALDGEGIVGCGGWSRRRKVYSGSASANGEQDLLDPATEPARIRAMFVRPEWARRGIGRQILQHAEEQAASEGFRSLRLVAMRSAGSIYEAAGYRKVADSPIALEDGVVLECTLMEKSIDDSRPLLE
jgi:GNAT superfamily N-acetyltransferase